MKLLSFFFGADFISGLALTWNIAYWKILVAGLLGWLWFQAQHLFLFATVQPSMKIVWTLWTLNLFSGMAASWVAGAKDEKGNLIYINDQNVATPLSQGGHLLKGLKSFSTKKAAQGVGRLLYLWSVLILAANVIRLYESHSVFETLIIETVCGTIELFVISTIFISFLRNVSRANGFERGVALGDTLESRIDFAMGKAKELDRQIEEAHAEQTAVPPKDGILIPSSPLTIFLVESEPLERASLAKIYHTAGHNCMTSKDPEDLEKLLMKSTPDLVICAVYPDAVPVALLVKKITPLVPMVAITSLILTPDKDWTALSALGYKAVVPKMDAGGTPEFLARTLFFAHRFNKEDKPHAQI